MIRAVSNREDYLEGKCPGFQEYKHSKTSKSLNGEETHECLINLNGEEARQYLARTL